MSNGPEELKEYNWIRCQEAGIQYKKLVRSFGEFQWGRSILFIHRSHPGKIPYVISDKNSGMSVAVGLRTPTVRAAKLHLTQNLTDEQDVVLNLLPSQRLLMAYHNRKLKDLPYRKEVANQIIWALEERITSSNPF